MSEKNNVRICIIMLGLFGDVLMRTPVLRSIKKKYPNSSITVVVDKIGKDLLYNNPDINDIILMNRNRKNLLAYMISKINTQYKIMLSKFDFIIDLYLGASSKRIVNFSFAKHKYPSLDDVKNENINCLDYPNPKHASYHLFGLLKQMNLDKNDIDITPIFHINKEVENSLLKQNDFLKNKQNFLISLGSGDLKKMLDMGKIYKMLKFLYDKYKLEAMVVCNPTQEFLQSDLIDNYLKPNKIPYIKLDKKSIDEIAIFIKYSKFFIVPDTGLFHLSLALKTPTFCVFTYTHPSIVCPENDEIIYQQCHEIKQPVEYDNYGTQRCTKEIQTEKILSNLDIFINKIQGANNAKI